MGRRPLDPEAVRAADDAFYAKHPELVKDGVRQKLDPLDPEQAALRKEWWKDYDAAAAEAGQPEPEEPDAGSETSKPAKGKEGCPNDDWISIALKSKDELEGYDGEMVSAVLTDGTQPEVPLGGGGKKRWDGIPCGSCSFQFKEFYDEIEAWLDEQAAG